MRQNSHKNSYSCRLKREELQSESLKDQSPKILPENFYREHPLATQAQTRGVSEKVDVRNTDPLELFKRVPVPLTQKWGLKKDFPSPVEKRIQMLIGECLGKKTLRSKKQA